MNFTNLNYEKCFIKDQVGYSYSAPYDVDKVRKVMATAYTNFLKERHCGYY